MSADVAIADLAVKLDAILSRDELWPRFLSVDLAATYCSMSPVSIRRLIAGGKLNPLRPVKGRIVLDRLALEAFVLSSNQRPRKGRGIKH